jgi:hypothetical protein
MKTEDIQQVLQEIQAVREMVDSFGAHHGLLRGRLLHIIIIRTLLELKAAESIIAFAEEKDFPDAKNFTKAFCQQITQNNLELLKGLSFVQKETDPEARVDATFVKEACRLLDNALERFSK